MEHVLDFSAPFPSRPGFRMGASGLVVGVGGAGHVVGKLVLVDESTAAQSRVFFLCAPGAEPEILFEEGDLVDPVRHPQMQWTDALEFYVSDSGSICMLAKVNDPSKSTLPIHALISGPVFDLQVVCYDGQLEAGPVGYITAVQLSSAGRLAFVMRSSVWFDALDEALRPLVANTSYSGLPEGSVFGAAYSPLRLNAVDGLAFQGTIASTGDGGELSYISGVYIRDAGELRPFLLVGSPAPPEFPGTSIGFVSPSDGLFFTDSGWCAAKVTHTGPPEGRYNGPAVYVGRAGNPVPVVSAGMEAPETSGGVFGWNLRLHGASDAGDVLFQNTIALSEGGAPDSCWRWSDGRLEQLAVEGEATTAFSDGLLRDLQGMAISPEGRVVLHARSFAEHALFLQEAPGQATQRFLGSGDPFEGPAVDERTIESISLEVPPHGRRFDAQGRVLARIHDLSLRGTLAWVDPAQLGPGGGGFGLGSFSGRVVEDVDQSGEVSSPDPGIPDAAVVVFEADASGDPRGEPLATYRTDANGYYLVRIAPGDYVASYTTTRGPGGIPQVISRGVTVVSDQETVDVNLLDPFLPAPLSGIALSLLSPDPRNIGHPDRFLTLSPLEANGGLCADGNAILLVAIEATQAPPEMPLRWELLAMRGGSVDGGLDQHLRWYDPVIQSFGRMEAPKVIRTAAASEEAPGYAFLAISPLSPAALTFTDGTPEIELLLRVFSAESKDQAVSVPIRLRRPPLFLIPSDPSERWGEEFLQALYVSRHPELVQSLTYPPPRRSGATPSYQVDELLQALDWNGRVGQIRSRWSLVHPDVIAHGQGGAVLMGLSLANAGSDGELNYHNSENFGYGRYRAAVLLGSSLGTSGVSLGAGFGNPGIVPSYAAKLHAKLAELGESLGNSALSYVPHSVAKVPAWSAWLQRDGEQPYAAPFLGPVRADPIYDATAPVHLMASRINAIESQAYRQIGFNALVRRALTPLGADGVVGVESALLVSPEEFSENDPKRTILSGYLAHGDDRFLFGEAPKQTFSAAAAQAAVAVLDRGEPSAFFSADALAQVWIERIQDEALRLAVADHLIDLAIRPVLAQLQPVNELPAQHGLDQTFTVDLQEVPAEPLTGGPFWFAEVLGEHGASSDGLTVVPDAAEPTRVFVTVAEEVIGDVVLYASYETAAGTVMATPIRLVSSPPPEAEPIGLSMEPKATVLDLHGTVTPAFWVQYSDGSTMRRWLLPGEFSLSSSVSAVLDVENKTRWVARSEGETVVTVNHAGMTAQTTLSVVNPYPPLTYAAWKEQVFDPAAIADPLVSGDGADADGDDVTTLFEYIARGNPLESDRGLRPRMEQVDLGNGYRRAFVVRLAARLAAGPIAAERSLDLENWQTVVSWTGAKRPSRSPVVLAVIDLGEAYEVWVDPGDTAGQSAFYRLAVTLN